MNHMDEIVSTDQAATIIKRGELCICFTMHRNLLHARDGVGLTLSVKTHPSVEEFMRQQSPDSPPIEVKAAGRHWVSLDKEHPLLAYRMAEKIPFVESDDDTGCFSLDYLGNPLIITDDRHRKPLLNLSFLRLVGISEGAGVTFGIKGVQSLDSLKETRDNLSTACRRFYGRYLKPVDLTVMVSTQELNT